MGSSRAGSVLWERAPPAKGWRQPPGRIPETFLFRCPVLRIRDAVQWWCLPGPLKPSLAAVSLALPGQTAPSRHHHCPAHWAAEPPRVRTPPGPFYEVGLVAANLPRSAGIGWARPGPCLARDGQSGPPPGRAYRDVLAACPGRAHPIPVRAFWREKPLEYCGATFAGWLKATLSRARPAPTNTTFIERFGVSDNPGPGKPPRSVSGETNAR